MRSWLLAIAAVVVVAAACDQVPLTSPTGSTIYALATDTSIVPVNGHAEITAIVIESSGTAVHNGTMVTFRADFGRLDPTTAETAGGRALTRFYPDGRFGYGQDQRAIRSRDHQRQLIVGRNHAARRRCAAARLSVACRPAHIFRRPAAPCSSLRTCCDTNGNSLPGAPCRFPSPQHGRNTGPAPSSARLTDASGSHGPRSLPTRRHHGHGNGRARRCDRRHRQRCAYRARRAKRHAHLPATTTSQSVGVHCHCTIGATSLGAHRFSTSRSTGATVSGEIALGAVSGDVHGLPHVRPVPGHTPS